MVDRAAGIITTTRTLRLLIKAIALNGRAKGITATRTPTAVLSTPTIRRRSSEQIMGWGQPVNCKTNPDKLSLYTNNKVVMFGGVI